MYLSKNEYINNLLRMIPWIVEFVLWFTMIYDAMLMCWLSGLNAEFACILLFIWFKYMYGEVNDVFNQELNVATLFKE